MEEFVIKLMLGLAAGVGVALIGMAIYIWRGGKF